MESRKDLFHVRRRTVLPTSLIARIILSVVVYLGSRRPPSPRYVIGEIQELFYTLASF